MVYFCDYLPAVQEAMKKNGVTNDDVQEIFNAGMSEGQTRRYIDKDGYHIGILFHYDGYTARYVIEAVTKRPLRSAYAAKVAAKNLGK